MSVNKIIQSTTYIFTYYNLRGISIHRHDSYNDIRIMVPNDLFYFLGYDGRPTYSADVKYKINTSLHLQKYYDFLHVLTTLLPLSKTV